MHPSTLRSLSNAEFVRDPCEDDPTVFSFSELTGEVRGGTLPQSARPAIGYQTTEVSPAISASTTSVWDLSREPITLQVHFAPKRAVCYHSLFRFQVECGEPVELQLYGSGTMDERAQVEAAI